MTTKQALLAEFLGMCQERHPETGAPRWDLFMEQDGPTSMRFSPTKMAAWLSAALDRVERGVWQRIIDRSDDMVREIEKRQEAGAYIALDNFIREIARENGHELPTLAERG